jgi:hypothetical protein
VEVQPSALTAAWVYDWLYGTPPEKPQITGRVHVTLCPLLSRCRRRRFKLALTTKFTERSARRWQRQCQGSSPATRGTSPSPGSTDHTTKNEEGVGTSEKGGEGDDPGSMCPHLHTSPSGPVGGMHTLAQKASTLCVGTSEIVQPPHPAPVKREPTAPASLKTTNNKRRQSKSKGHDRFRLCAPAPNFILNFICNFYKNK